MTGNVATLFDRVDTTGDCWLWTGGKTGGGYGTAVVNNRQATVHRAIYEWMVEPVPTELDLDHLCRVRHCVNPFHLEPVTRRENLLRGETIPAKEARQTHCHRGHPFNKTNTYKRPDGKGRDCRECRTIADRKRRRTNKES